MHLAVGVLRATEDAVDALARLDERARYAPDISPVLALRSAQAIVSANERPPDVVRESAGRPAVSQATSLDGEAAYAALIGWWLVPEAREFIAHDPHLCSVMVALNDASSKVCNGRTLTPGLLDEAAMAAGMASGSLSALIDATLSVAEREAWPGVLLAADLAAGPTGREQGVLASLARTVALLTAGIATHACVVPPPADDVASALHAIARSAREGQQHVSRYRQACTAAVARCEEFGRGAPTASALARRLASHPAVTVKRATQALGVSAPAAGDAIERLCDAELLRELTGRKRDRVFVYTPAIALAG
jgi:hypothetical protein